MIFKLEMYFNSMNYTKNPLFTNTKNYSPDVVYSLVNKIRSCMHDEKVKVKNFIIDM